MEHLKIRYTRDAVDDLDSIFAYIAQDKQTAAQKMLEKIEQSILKIADNPRLGSVLPTTNLSIVEPGYRKMIVKPYIIFYRFDDRNLFISRILHSKQDWLSIVFETEFDE